MVPNPSLSHTPAERGPTIPAHALHRRLPHGSALPLLGTMSTTLLLALAIILLTATGVSGGLEAPAYILS